MTISPILDGEPLVPSKSFLQSRFWAGFKRVFGWSTIRFRVITDEVDATVAHGGACAALPYEVTHELSVLVRRLVGPLTFAYIPHGPETGCQNVTYQEQLIHLAEALRAWLPRTCMFIRFDPGWFNVGSEMGNPDRPVFSLPLVKASDVQPPDTVVLDLTCSEEELLAGMKPKWRYNIKLADKKNVLVTEEGPADLDTFYKLYQQTAVRDRIAVHPKNYYEKLFELASKHQAMDIHSSSGEDSTDGQPGNPGNTGNSASQDKREPLPDLRLWVARHEGQALACIVTLFFGSTATYLYGASSDEKRNLMPAYALQWAAIKAARAAGCLEYDMYGIPPTNDEHHPMAGLYRFKTGFGGELRHYPGAWDYVYMPLLYTVFRTAERTRLIWHKKIKKSRR